MSSKKLPEMPAASNDFFKAARMPEPYDFGPSLTRQEFADEANINVLMAQYERTGVMPGLDGQLPTFVDFTGMPTDLMEVMDMMLQAEGAFMQLPAKVRRQFDNDPKAFVDFAQDPENLDQMRVWGLAPPAELPDAPKEEPAAATPPKAAEPPAPSKAP